MSVASDQKEYERLLSNWRLTPATLMHKISRGAWIASPWLMYASARVASGIARGNARIIISAPPRHGKSELISVGTSTWVLETQPNKNVILAAYGADLAEGFGRKVRDLIRDNGELLKVKLKDNRGQVGSFLTDQNGYMFSIGLGGAITGRGAHVLLIDDFIKEIKEALSPAHRQYIWDWYVTTARTRLEPGGSIIIIATRWHSDDLIGRLLKNFPGRWENIVLPAIAEGDEGFRDVIGRSPGDALFPDRYPKEALHEIQEEMGTTYFSAMFQQRPIDEGKKIADGAWLKQIDQLPLLDQSTVKKFRIWDLAATEGGGDFTVGTLASYDRSDKKMYIEDIKRKQLSPEEVERTVRELAINDGIEVEIGIEQEPGSAGKALVEHYSRNVLPEFKVHPIPVSGQNSKIIRAQPLLAAAESGRVYVLKAHWTEAFVHEFDLFPTGPYDDQVDTAAAAYVKLAGKRFLSASWGRRDRPDGELAPGTKQHQNNKAIRSASMVAGFRRTASWGRR